MNPQPLLENKTYVIIDTCVIQHAGSSDKGKSEAIISCLKDVASEGYNLAISEFTLYENLHGLWGKRAQQAAKTLKSYEWKIVSNQVLIVASILGGLYKDEQVDYMNAGDKIIAATAVLEHAFVLTENHRDFPSPFFTLKKFYPIVYKLSHHNRTIDLALYEPHETLIARRINEKDRTS